MNAKSLLRKARNLIFYRIAAKLFQQSNKDYYQRPTFWKQAKNGLNQWSNENAFPNPFIFSKKDCLSFWQRIDNTSTSTGNRPEKYGEKTHEIIHVLRDFITPWVTLESRILELGCNCGANLYWLDSLGYKSLSGVEINPEALSYAQKIHPQLKSRVTFINDDLSAALSKMPDKSVDLIFTMAVAMHIHPADREVFREMTRVARKFICTVEPETANSNYVFARNYGRVFTQLGMRQVKTLFLKEGAASLTHSYAGFTLRLFEFSES